MFEIIKQDKDKECKSIKSVLILMPLTIPATGKSTVFNLMKQRVKKIKIEILGSDIMRGQKMKELLSKNPNMQKQQAYLLTKKQADAQFYIRLQHILEQAYHNSQFDHTAVVLDKNYSLVTFHEAIQQIKKITHKYEEKLVTKIIGVVPKCKKQLRLNQQIIYPFSSCYIACCMKRVLSREKHQTLEGDQIKRAITCIGWANNFRNINIKEAIHQKLFDGTINIQFTKEQELPILIEQYIKQFLISAKFNCFQMNEGSILPKLIQQLKKWQNQQILPKESLEQVQQDLNALFL